MNGVSSANAEAETSERSGDSSPATCSRLDVLCQRMLQLGAFADGTADMKASEIKERLLPFFGQETIDRAVAAICGENANNERRQESPERKP